MASTIPAQRASISSRSPRIFSTISTCSPFYRCGHLFPASFQLAFRRQHAHSRSKRHDRKKSYPKYLGKSMEDFRVFEDVTTVTGEIAVMLGPLGCRQGDSRILEPIALVGCFKMEVEEFDFDGEKSKHYIFKAAGTELVFEDEILVSIMVRTQPDDQDETYGLYPRPEALIDGLSPTATRAEVAALLGNPERVGPNFDRYEVNGNYLHFEFDSNSRVARLSALLDAL